MYDRIESILLLPSDTWPRFELISVAEDPQYQSMRLGTVCSGGIAGGTSRMGPGVT